MEPNHEKLTDYNFGASWHRNQLDIKPSEEYVVLTDLGDLKKGERVKFIGYDDVDNHFGIFVFVDTEGKVLEVSGDFAGTDRVRQVELALSKA